MFMKKILVKILVMIEDIILDDYKDIIEIYLFLRENIKVKRNLIMLELVNQLQKSVNQL